jgi:small subunit ribosomal protein S10
MKARIKLSSPNLSTLRDISDQIMSISKSTGVKSRGPIALPTKKLLIPVLRTPCGDGSKTWEHWQMRIHKRIVDIDADERTLRQIMRVQVPEKVHIEIELKS